MKYSISEEKVNVSPELIVCVTENNVHLSGGLDQVPPKASHEAWSEMVPPTAYASCIPSGISSNTENAINASKFFNAHIVFE